jgi:hypothetical protein
MCTYASRGQIFLLGALLLAPVSAFCGRNHPQPILDALRVDKLGESVRAFRSIHRKASCHRIHGAWEEGAPKTVRLMWMYCSFDRGARFAGYELLSELHPEYPFGADATFYKKRLVEITYTISDANVESIVSLIEQEYGPPLGSTRDENSVMMQARWASKRLSVVVRAVPIQAQTSTTG